MQRSAPLSLTRPARASRTRTREAIAGYLFVSPVVLGIMFFTLAPVITALYYSFTTFDMLSPPRWIGLHNYQRLVGDPLWWHSLGVTVEYALLAVPIGLVCSFGLALLLNQDVRGLRLWRAVFYLPVVFPAVAAALVWSNMYNPQSGVFDDLLTRAHLPTVPWLQDPSTAITSLVLLSLWGVGGGMLLWLSGLQSVPQHLYEAASIDGANAWRRFWSVTVPMLTPIIFFNLVMGVIGSLQTFTQTFIMTAGGPLNATFFIVINIYQKAFQWFQMGYASAMAWVLFLIVAVLTLLIFRTSGWVYYEG
jgi:multiple sugar transport system permease protein